MLDLPGCQDVDGKLGHLHLVVQLEHAVEVVGTAEPVLKVEFKHWEGGGGPSKATNKMPGTVLSSPTDDINIGRTRSSNIFYNGFTSNYM